MRGGGGAASLRGRDDDGDRALETVLKENAAVTRPTRLLKPT